MAPLTTTAARPIATPLDPRLAGVERMAAPRLAAVDRQRERHRLLMRDASVLAGSDAAIDAMDAGNALARVFPGAEEMGRRSAAVLGIPGERDRLAEACTRAKAHRFALLGTPLMPLGRDLDWHCDYRVSKRYPREVDYLALGRAAFPLLVDREHEAELKFVWDLNNLHWLPALAAGRHALADPTCATAIADDIRSWLAANPPFAGVNWFCPMNVAMRAANLIAALAACSGELDPGLRRDALRSLFRHGLCIMGHLEVETAAKRNNHYLTNLMGMQLLGWLFRDLPLGAEWLAFATAELEAEATYQFLPDGVCFEDSTSYHRLSTEMLLLAAITARRNDRPMSAGFLAQLTRALHFTRDILGPDQRIPQFGDNDNGRIVQYAGYGSMAGTDHRHLLALGGEFLDDDVLRLAGAGAQADPLWLLGSWREPVRAATATASHSYPASGFHICRDPASTLVVHNGRISLPSAGGHAHCDQLSFTLHQGNRQIFVDPGSYRYSSDFAARNAFRSVAYHNTVQVDDLPMHVYDTATFEGLWWMIDGAAAETREVRLDGGTWRFTGAHSGFRTANARVERTLAWRPASGALELTDAVLPIDPARGLAAATTARSRLLLGPGIEVQLDDRYRLALLADGRRIGSLTATVPALVRHLWFSPGYGSRVPALQLEFAWHPSRTAQVTIGIELGGPGSVVPAMPVS